MNGLDMIQIGMRFWTIVKTRQHIIHCIRNSFCAKKSYDSDVKAY